MMMDNISSYKNKECKLTINIEFDTKIELTPRIIEVSDAFGLGVSESKKFTIYKDFRIGFSLGDVVFITGDSGGGKSLLLKKIHDDLYTNSANKPMLKFIKPNPEENIIDIGKTLDEGIKYLSMMGLNDAFVFLRKYKELSDGQKYRYRLAKVLSTTPQFLFIDEFCANLDRTTAKVIAYNLQKIARKNDMVLFCATTHRDIIEDLNPSVLVDKEYMDKVNIRYIPYKKKQISFYDEITIQKETIQAYKKLSKYHYKNTGINFPYTIIITARYAKELVGVAVFSPPFLQTKGRSIKFGDTYTRMKKEVVRNINKRFIRGSRYVVSPKYRACGLGQKLVKESLKYLNKYKYLEVITVMGKYNPVFEKVGMEKIEITEETDPPTIALDKWMKEKNLEIDEIHNPKYWNEWVDNLSETDSNTLKLMTGKVLHHPKLGLSSKEGRRAEVVAQEERYKKVEFKEVKDEIIIHIPKLYSGMTIYYICENKNYKEKEILKLDKWVE